MELWDRNLEVLLRTDPALAALVHNHPDQEALSIERAKNG